MELKINTHITGGTSLKRSTCDSVPETSNTLLFQKGETIYTILKYQSHIIHTNKIKDN